MSDSASAASVYTAADAVLDALRASGVTHLFGNFGSDHPEFIESLARGQRSGNNTPRVVVCPHESVALAAAHGHTLLSRQTQAVMVHCDVGTQTLGGAVHNAARARVPVFIFAGETPITIDRGLVGGRNRPVNTLQDVHDQHSIVRSYVKWSAPLKSGHNARQMTLRAMQIATSAPTGPVYLTGAREYLSEAIGHVPRESAARYPALEPAALPPGAADDIVRVLERAEHPLVVVSGAGVNPAFAPALDAFVAALGVMVVESWPSCVNLRADHPLHVGHDADARVGDADAVLVLDSDVAWSTSAVRLADDVPVFHVDTDPVKTGFVLWHTPATRAWQADATVVVGQLHAALAGLDVDAARLERRLAAAAERRAVNESARVAAEQAPADGSISVGLLLATLRGLIDPHTVIADESVTNNEPVWRHLPRTRPATYFNSGGSALGWHGGAAIGMKLARPDATVVALAGDGSYLFSVPSSVHWVAAHHGAPFLTVVLNNGGWNATRMNTLRLHPDGAAARADRFFVNLDRDTDFAGMARAAGPGSAATVGEAAALESTLSEALAAVRGGTAAVVNVLLPPISAQPF